MTNFTAFALADALINIRLELECLQPHLTPSQADQAYETVLSNILIVLRERGPRFDELRFREYIKKGVKA